ncbi:uncharacterized protein LOC121741225 [Salvia splendens]|uniref:uncharacterized protein LOC121741225 n=1 Tax=Salvia splendens TaxID=180675 RepID=UPI001C26A9B8|nr:uncharacterized protein LOC121741225 [Salvia splendens]
MLYATSKNSLKKVLDGIQATDPAEMELDTSTSVLSTDNQAMVESEEMEMNNAAGKNRREQASSSRSGLVLGLAPSFEYTFLVYASPVGNYFKEGTALISLYVEDEFHRAGRGGSGGVKSVTNYAPVRP